MSKDNLNMLRRVAAKVVSAVKFLATTEAGSQLALGNSSKSNAFDKFIDDAQN
jgi:hypothetical protein